jgi:hypothetical protein
VADSRRGRMPSLGCGPVGRGGSFGAYRPALRPKD